MSVRADGITELITDHREVDELFAHLEKSSPGDDGARALADRLTTELVRHSVAEEQHLYPAVRAHLPGGDRIADKEIADHAKVEQLLKDLEGLRAGDPRFTRLVSTLKSEVTAHVRDEENNLFPALRKHCSAEAIDELGDRLRRAKKTAPTRPHPGTPDTPPANKLLAPGAGLVDRVRDALSGRGK
ncbi:hemerythrin domain-containing protein [Streptomyces sp. NPDC054863]